MSPPTTHLDVQAGGGVLGGAAFPPEFPREVVELGKDGVGEAGLPPCQLKQEPGAGHERSRQFLLRVLLRTGWGPFLASLCSLWGSLATQISLRELRVLPWLSP